MFNDEGDFHASVFILGPDDTTVLIRETTKQPPLWKFPGGARKLTKDFLQPRRDERPEETAVRETMEETGLSIDPNKLVLVANEDMGTYTKYYFMTKIRSWNKLRALSDEYEETHIFKIRTLQHLGGFHRRYRDCFFQHVKPKLQELTAGR